MVRPNVPNPRTTKLRLLSLMRPPLAFRRYMWLPFRWYSKPGAGSGLPVRRAFDGWARRPGGGDECGPGTRASAGIELIRTERRRQQVAERMARADAAFVVDEQHFGFRAAEFEQSLTAVAAGRTGFVAGR